VAKTQWGDLDEIILSTFASVKDNFDMLKSFLRCPLRRTMNIISLCKFPLGAATCWWDKEYPALLFTGLNQSPFFAHLRDILLSKTNDFHLIYFHCFAPLCLARGGKGFS